MGVAHLASHSAVRMVLALCGTLLTYSQNEEVLVIEYAEPGLLRTYSRLQSEMDFGRETAGRLDSAHISVGLLSLHKLSTSAQPLLDPQGFAENDLEHVDAQGGHHDRFDTLLPRVLGPWMRGRDLVRPMAGTTERPTRIREALGQPHERGQRLIWIGGEPLWGEGMVLHTRSGTVAVDGDEDELDWLAQVLEAATVHDELTVQQATEAFPGAFEDFTERWAMVRKAGLLLV